MSETETEAETEIEDDAILKHAEAMYEAAAKEARKWHAVVVALRGEPPAPAAPPRHGGRKRLAIVLAREYLATFGPVRGCSAIALWMADRGLEITKDKLRQYLWMSDEFGYDDAKGGWHLTSVAPAEPVPGVNYE